MTTASENRFAELIKEDILSCPICFEILTDPKTLPCLHTYCKGCLLKIVEIRNKKFRFIRCPECRAEMRLFKNGVEDLKSSFFIHSLMDMYNTKRQIVACTVCKQRGQTRNAVSKCTTCGDGLCQQCSAGHLQSTMTALHMVVPLKDFASGIHDSKLRDTQNFPCSVHTKEIEYYCMSCEAVACLSCVLLDHKEHKYTSLQDAYDSKKGELEAMFTEVQSKVLAVEAAIVRVLTLKDQASKKSLEITKRITDTGQTVLNAVGKEITETKQNAEKVIRPRLERLKKVFEDLAQKIKHGKNCIEFCKNILVNGKPVEVLQIEGLLRKRLQSLSQEDTVGNISEIEFNTRIEDVFINERFQGDVCLGIFQPDPKLSREPVGCEKEIQTDVSWSESGTNRTQCASADVPDAALFVDSGRESQILRQSVSGEPSLQAISPKSDSSGNGDTNNPDRPSDSSIIRTREAILEHGHGEPAEAVPGHVTKEPRSKGDNWFYDIPGDPTYGNPNLLCVNQTSPLFFGYVIAQVMNLLFALVAMLLEPIMWDVMLEIDIEQ